MTAQTNYPQLTTALRAKPASERSNPTGPFVLYGAGNKGRELLALLRNQGLAVRAFIDRAGHGEHAGVPIFTPDNPAVARLAHEGCTAIVTVFNPGVDPLPIHAWLTGQGFRRVVGMVEARHIGMASDTYWLASCAAMTPPVHEAEWLFDTLADEASRQTLMEAILLRRTGDVSQLRSPAPSEQYIPAGLPVPRANVRFVDGGAFDGDTILQLLNSGVSFEAVAAFEPDSANYAALVARVKVSLGGAATSLWPCGLDATTRQVRFQADGLASSGITAQGETMIQTVAFDSALPGWCPNYVKLDIEGAERDALYGMAATLQAVRPALAVCVYHKPADLWELPRVVAELLPNVDLFLRSHAWNGFDLVLYAIPRGMAQF